MFWKTIEQLLGASTRMTFPIQERRIGSATALCRLCRGRAKQVGAAQLLQVECCDSMLCLPCYQFYFYAPGATSTASPSKNNVDALLRGLLVVPALWDEYKKLNRICTFRCPFCRATTTYRLNENRKEIRRPTKP
jgi:hypothetical protein